MQKKIKEFSLGHCHKAMKTEIQRELAEFEALVDEVSRGQLRCLHPR